MINRLQLLRNIGQFDSVSSGAKLDLGKLTLIYAENGRGKTTLSSILRSLATGEPLPILERHRLGAAHSPEVVVICSGNATARFQNGAWSQLCPEMAIFDDVFVDSNVHSGLDVGAEHRQALHELILGEQGVTLARSVNQIAQDIRDQNAEVRVKTAILHGVECHGIAPDNFCALAPVSDLAAAIKAAEDRLAALEHAATISTKEGFASLSLPDIDPPSLRALLSTSVDDIDAQALFMVRAHFSSLGTGGEAWVSSGTDFASNIAARGSGPCPFCLQSLAGSAIISAYRGHFAQGYKNLTANIQRGKLNLEAALKGDALAGFGRQVQNAQAAQTFWSGFCSMPGVAVDTTAIGSAWQGVRDSILAAFAEKQADPLRVVVMDAKAEAALTQYSVAARSVADASLALSRANEDIERVKEGSKSGNVAAARSALAQLKATQARYVASTATICDEYLSAKAKKDLLDAQKGAAQKALDAHRSIVFAPYQAAINKYLTLFNARFSVEQVQSQNTAGTPSCNYQLRINAHRVPLAGTSGPRFKNTLSAGDRNTLALPFFFASLDRDPAKASKVVVLDDPVSSLDEHRTLATVQEIRALAQQVAQVIVLSHSKPFLARVWQHADQKQTVALEVTRDSAGSTIASWNVNDDSVTEYDRRYARLRDYAASNSGTPREVATAIRPILEGYLRVTCSTDFRPGTLLGQFQQIAKDRAAAGKPILTDAKLVDLESLTEYGNRFHHDTNPAWDTEQINDGELRGFVSHTLGFVSA